MTAQIETQDQMTAEQWESMTDAEKAKYARSKESYLNAPTDMQDAIDRIMELEMRLEDLARASEIVEITRQFELFEGFRKSAEEALEKKITIDRPIPTEKMKITVVTGEVAQETIDNHAKA
jgi:hypothetical protein